MSILTEFFRWCITDERTDKRRRTTYRLTREQAGRLWTDAEPHLQGREVRHVPEPGDANSPPRGEPSGAGIRAGSPRPHGTRRGPPPRVVEGAKEVSD